MATNHIFCDESHIDSHQYRVQGGIWVPDIGMRAVRGAFTEFRLKHPKIGELKWANIRGRRPLTAYMDLMDLFFRSEVAPLLRFNCLVVRRADDASQQSDKAGQDLGFFKAYYTLLYYRLWRGSDNHIRIDERSSPRKAPAVQLGERLNNSANNYLEHPFRVLSCYMARSHDEDLLQLADVLCGLVGWAWNGKQSTCGAKPLFDAHVAGLIKRRVPTLHGYQTGISEPKFNVWLYRPKAQK